MKPVNTMSVEELVAYLKERQRGIARPIDMRQKETLKSTSTSTSTSKANSSPGSSLPTKSANSTQTPEPVKEPEVPQETVIETVKEPEPIEKKLEEPTDWVTPLAVGGALLAGGALGGKLIKGLKTRGATKLGKGGMNFNPEVKPKSRADWNKKVQLGAIEKDAPPARGKGDKAQTSLGFEEAPNMKELTEKAGDVKALHKGIVDYRDAKDLADADVANIKAKVNDPVIGVTGDAGLMREVPIYKAKQRQKKMQGEKAKEAFENTQIELGNTPEAQNIQWNKLKADSDVNNLMRGIKDPIKGVGGRNAYNIEDAWKKIGEQRIADFSNLTASEQLANAKAVVSRNLQRDGTKASAKDISALAKRLIDKLKGEAKGLGMKTHSPKPKKAPSAPSTAPAPTNKYGKPVTDEMRKWVDDRLTSKAKAATHSSADTRSNYKGKPSLEEQLSKKLKVTVAEANKQIDAKARVLSIRNKLRAPEARKQAIKELLGE